MKTTDLVSILVGIVGATFAFVNIDDFKLKLIITLFIAIVLLIIKIVLLTIENNRISKELKTIEQRHIALSKKYKLKKSKLDLMYRYWLYMENLFRSTNIRTEIDRFQVAEKQYREYTDDIEYYFKED